MPRVNMYRFFDLAGKPGVRPYKRMFDKLSKYEAARIADNTRRKGNLARIVKEADGYTIFVLVRK